MTGRRNHYIPRFMLSRFASRRLGKKSWIWQVDRTNTREISTKDAAVSHDFYGRPETGIENALSLLESRLAASIAALEAGQLTRANDDDLRTLVWNMVFRGKASREQLADTGARVAENLAAPKYRALALDAMRAMAHANLDELLREVLDRLPEPAAAAFRMHVASSQRDELIESILRNIDGPGGGLDAAYQAGANARVKAGFQEAARSGQIGGLKKLLTESAQPVANNFRPDRWLVLRFRENLVLGDSCVVAVSADGSTGTYFNRSETWVQLYLPVSSNTVLFADRGSITQPWDDARRLNAASASHSTTHIYSAQRNPDLESLQLAIGTRDAVLDEEQVDQLIANGWRDLARE